jgi:hypothetical protein
LNSISQPSTSSRGPTIVSAILEDSITEIQPTRTKSRILITKITPKANKKTIINSLDKSNESINFLDENIRSKFFFYLNQI